MENKFTEELFSRLNPEERIFKFRSAEISGKIIIINFLVRSDDYKNLLTDRLREKLRDVCVDILPDELTVSIGFTQTEATKKNVVNKIVEYVFREHKSIFPIIEKAKFEFENDGAVFTVTTTLEKYVYDYAKGIDLAGKLKEYLDTEFMEEAEIVFNDKPNSEYAPVPEIRVSAGAIRVIDAKPTNVYVKGPMDYPRYIVDIAEKEKEETNLTLCGVVSDINMRKIVKPDAKIKEKELYTFLLNDTTARVKCKFFAKVKEGFDWGTVFFDNAKLLMNGVYKYDSFDNKYCFYASSVAAAEIDFSSIQLKSDFNFDYGKYLHVVPEPYNDVAQYNFFEMQNDNPDLINNVYVVFDLETTGLSTESDEIIEIAAIKIEKGKFTEKFSTFVKPSESISREITSITGITDAMVVHAPTASEMIPDFFHFAKGSILVGHNIGNFDIPLLNTQAAKYKYEFNNDFEDTLTLARRKLNLSRYKLSEVCSALNVPLVGAHRAINDVAANAKVFLKLKNL